MEIEKKISEKTIYDGRILSLHVDTIELPNGKEGLRECVEHKNGAGILVKHGGEFVFVRQYRYAVGKEMLEIPAGLVEPGEDARETAERELQEEIGLKPKRLEFFVDMYVSPGFTTERTSVFYASEFEESRLEPDDDEFLEIVRIPVERAREMYLKGEFEDAKTVCALGYYFSR